MTETDNSPSPSKPPRGAGNEIAWFGLAFLVTAGLFAAAFWPPAHDRLMSAVSTAEPSQQKLEAAERKIQELDTRINVLETRVENIAVSPQPPVSAPAPAPASVTDLAHMQSDLTQLATTVGGLQNQVKQSDVATHAVAEEALAKMIAFMQLRDATAAGRGFAKELDALRAATKTDVDLKHPLDAMAPYAEKGAPDIASLRAQLDEQAVATEVATAKAGAQTWWERVLAEFRGLVLIRPLHEADTQDNALMAMKSSLAQGDLTAALTAMNNLVPDAQKILDDWRKKAEARQAIDNAMRMIADHLVAVKEAVPTPTVPPPALPAPIVPKPITPKATAPAPVDRDDTSPDPNKDEP